MTGGAQSWVDSSFPGAFYKDTGVQYVCVCGSTVEGVKRDVWKREKASPPSYAFSSYEQVRCYAHDFLDMNPQDSYNPVFASSIELAALHTVSCTECTVTARFSHLRPDCFHGSHWPGTKH